MSRKADFTLVAGFVAGCAVAALVPMVISPATAQTTTRWETQCVPVDRTLTSRIASEMNELGNRLGAQGWELVSAPGSIVAGSNQVACFKRPAR